MNPTITSEPSSVEEKENVDQKANTNGGAVDQIQSTSEAVSDPYNKKGMVYNCAKLYVRKSPSKSASSTGVLDSGSIVDINNNKSTEDFYAVRISMNNQILKGYCMKKFISIEL